MFYGAILQDVMALQSLSKSKLTAIVIILMVWGQTAGVMVFADQPFASVVVKGQPAPYPGLLLSKEAAAQIVAQTEQQVQLETAKCTEQVKQCQAKGQKDLATCSVEVQAKYTKCADELKRVTEQAESEKWKWGIIGVVIGAVVGVISTAKAMWK